MTCSVQPVIKPKTLHQSKQRHLLPRKAKAVKIDYVRTTIYLPKRLHQQLKVAAVQGDKDMSEIIEGLVDAWVQSEES